MRVFAGAEPERTPRLERNPGPLAGEQRRRHGGQGDQGDHELVETAQPAPVLVVVEPGVERRQRGAADEGEQGRQRSRPSERAVAGHQPGRAEDEGGAIPDVHRRGTRHRGPLGAHRRSPGRKL